MWTGGAHRHRWVVASAREAGVTPPPATSTSLVVPDLMNLEPLAEVWPQAVRRLPDRLPDGSTYKIIEAIGGDKYLVTPATRSGCTTCRATTRGG
jgi:hypothetical protein